MSNASRQSSRTPLVTFVVLLAGAYAQAGAAGVTAGLGVATGYVSGGSGFVDRGWTGGATLRGDFGSSPRWRLQAGADYTIERGKQVSNLLQEHQDDWPVSFQALVATGGFRIRMSDSDAPPLPVHVDAGPGLALLHLRSEEPYAGRTVTRVVPAITAGIAIGRMVSASTEALVTVRGVISSRFSDPGGGVVHGREDGLRQVLLMVGFRHATRAADERVLRR
jgi:hypothetical protein